MSNFKPQAGFSPILILLVLLGLGAITGIGYYAFVGPKTQPMPYVLPVTKSPSEIAESKTIEAVKDANEESLLKMDGVSAVQVGEKDDKPCIVVFSFKETDELNNLEKTGVGGYEVVVESAPPQAN